MDQVLRKHLWILTLVSLALMAFFLAAGTGALLSKLFVSVDQPAPGDRRSARSRAKGRQTKVSFSKRSGDDICRTNVFNFGLRPCVEGVLSFDDESEEGDGDSTGVPSLCTAESKLVATMASSDPGWAFAMITAEGKTRPYRAGDEVVGLGKLARVGWRLVLVDSMGGGSCLMDLYPPAKAEAASGPRVTTAGNAPAASKSGRRGRGKLNPELQKAVDEGIEVVSANERNVDKGLVDRLIENSSELMSQARILPYERDGAVQGFKLYGIRRNSLLGKLGLRNGDIINSIGGMEMTSPDRALQAYTKLRSTSSLSVVVTRRGRRENLDFNIR